MLRTIGLGLTIAITVVAAGADARPASRTRVPARSRPAAVKPPPPLLVTLPATPAVPRAYMVPNEVVLRPTTRAEAEANAVWNLRAALNVAALQCQFSPFLATVRNYNDTLKQHGEEFTRAQTTMTGHFRRYDGAKALNGFDQYTTRTYNSYSTLDAQYSFCEQAALLGREVLTIPKNALGPIALRSYAEIRAALIPKPLSPALVFIGMEPLMIDLGPE